MSNEIIVLKRVRIGYPNIITGFKGQDGKYSAKFYLDPKNAEHAKVIKAIAAQMAGLIKDDLKGVKPTPDRICLKKGEDFGQSDFEKAHYILSANEKERPIVVGRDGKTKITDPNKVKGGNIVNAQVALWAQNHAEFGKRINCNLIAVQFVEDDGMTFSKRAAMDESLFEDFGDEDVGSTDDMGLDDDGFDSEVPF